VEISTKQELSISVVNCARCDTTHESLVFKRFLSPVRRCDTLLYTHWSICPVTREPILLRVTEEANYER
jgi:hypothetical protein